MFEFTKILRGRTRQSATLLFLLFFLAAGPARAAEDTAETLEIIRRVISERGEYDLAERQLNAFIEENRGKPTAAEALVLLGYCQDKQKKNTDAVASYSRVLSEYPGAPAQLLADASLGAADASFRLERYDEAARFYTQVLDHQGKPEQAEAALLWRGEANYRRAVATENNETEKVGLLKNAARDFAAFMDAHPESKQLPSAVSGAAFSSFDAGDFRASLGYFQRFARDFPSDKRAEEARFYIGESLYRMGEYDQAKSAYRQALAENPDGDFAADARAGEAWADYSLRRVAEAAAGFEEAADMAGEKDKRLALLYDAGCAWREAGDAQKAAGPLAEVAKAGDHELSGLAWFRLGTLWQEQARVARTRAESAATPAEQEKYAETQKKLGSEAIQYFSRALALGRLGDEEIEARSLMGEVQLDAGLFADAAKTFAEVASRWSASDRAPWALYHQALAERELARAADGKEAADRLAAAAAALKKSLDYPNAKTRLQAVWALADYQALLGEQDAARENCRWLASEGIEWAKNWKDAAGRPDPALENRAREYAADSLFRLGESYYFANDYPRASGFYEEIATSRPNTPQAAMSLLRQGEIAEAGNDGKTARARYEEALRLGLRLGKNRVGTTLGYAQLRLGALLLREGQKEGDGGARQKLLQESVRNLAAVLADPPQGLNLARPYYFLAEAKYSLGQKKEALADYEESIAADPDGELADAAWFGVAWAKRDDGDGRGALAAALKVVNDHPESSFRPDALALMAAIRRSEGDPDGALADLDRFLAEYGDHRLAAKAELERASALDETGKHEEAAAAFRNFLREHPDHPDVPQALYQRSWALWNRIRPQAGEAREKEEELRALTGGRPVEDLPDADRAAAAKLREELNSLNAELKTSEDEILSSLRDLTERHPDYPVIDAAWLRIGEILYDREDYPQALAAYQKALTAAEAAKSELADKAQYRMAWSIQRLAEAAEKTSLSDPDRQRRETARKDMWDRRVAAIDAFESMIGKFPKSELLGDACFRAAELRRRSGQDNAEQAKRSAWFESAVQRYRQALERGAQDAPYRQAAEYGEGLSLLLDGKSADAREAFRKLLLNPDGPYVQEAYWGLGQANLNLGAHADAAAAFEQALAVDKTTETAAKSRYGLGMTAVQAGDAAKARLEFLAVDSLYPNYPEWAAAALVRAARSALDEGMRDKAIGDLERVLARYGETPAADEARELQASISSAR